MTDSPAIRRRRIMATLAAAHEAGIVGAVTIQGDMPGIRWGIDFRSPDGGTWHRSYTTAEAEAVCDALRFTHHMPYAKHWEATP